MNFRSDLHAKNHKIMDGATGELEYGRIGFSDRICDAERRCHTVPRGGDARRYSGMVDVVHGVRRQAGIGRGNAVSQNRIFYAHAGGTIGAVPNFLRASRWNNWRRTNRCIGNAWRQSIRRAYPMIPATGSAPKSFSRSSRGRGRKRDCGSRMSDWANWNATMCAATCGDFLSAPASRPTSKSEKANPPRNEKESRLIPARIYFAIPLQFCFNFGIPWKNIAFQAL